MAQFSLSQFISVPNLNGSRPDLVSVTFGSAFKSNKEGHIDADLAVLVRSLILDGYNNAIGGDMIFTPLADFDIDPKQIVRDLLDWLESGAELKDGNKLIVGFDANDEHGDFSTNKVAIPLGEVIKTVESLWADSSPEVFPVSGNRRSIAGLFVETYKRMVGEAPIASYPGSIKVYKGSMVEKRSALFMDNIGFNEKDGVGKRNLSTWDRFVTAFEAYDRGIQQKALRDTFGVGTGQKLWRTCELDNYFPSLGVRAHVMGGNTKVGGKEDLKKILDLVSKDANDIAIKSESGKKKRAREADVLEKASSMWEAIQTGIAATRQKGASSKDMAAMSGRSRCEIVEKVLEAASRDALDEVAVFNGYAQTLNAALKAAESGRELTEALYLIDTDTGEMTNVVVTQEMVEQMQRQILALEADRKAATPKKGKKQA